jgi:hypothetical protein
MIHYSAMISYIHKQIIIYVLTSNETYNLYIIIEEDKKSQDNYNSNEIFI